MENNPNIAVSANNYGVNVYFTDTHKYHKLYYEKGLLEDIQLSGTTRYQPLDYRQKILFNRAMHGLNSYTEQEVAKMSFSEKMAVTELADKAQYMLNMWKQELIHSKIGSFLTTYFYKSDLAKDIANFPGSINPNYVCPITFKQLNIRKEQIFAKLVEEKILDYDLG